MSGYRYVYRHSIMYRLRHPLRQAPWRLAHEWRQESVALPGRAAPELRRIVTWPPQVQVQVQRFFTRPPVSARRGPSPSGDFKILDDQQKEARASFPASAPLVSSSLPPLVAIGVWIASFSLPFHLVIRRFIRRPLSGCCFGGFSTNSSLVSPSFLFLFFSDPSRPQARPPLARQANRGRDTRSTARHRAPSTSLARLLPSQCSSG